MKNHPADSIHQAWRCGDRLEAVWLSDLEIPGEYCALPAGHDGPHRADDGNQWR